MKTERQHIGAEAAIYAEGTRFTRDELVSAYENYCAACERNGEEPGGCQRFFARLTDEDSPISDSDIDDCE